MTLSGKEFKKRQLLMYKVGIKSMVIVDKLPSNKLCVDTIVPYNT